MEFSQKIRNLRNKAQETQAANKIIDMLDDLKMKNDETTSYRWIWELIQNAKDVVNTSGMVDITINFDQGNNSVEFKHNGKLFSTENVVFLIEQVSTKDRTITDEKSKNTTGKFGTGFLTTHLLSEKVRVSGYLQDVGESPYSFSVVLDRSGVDQQSIINAIQESCLELDKNTTIVIDKIIDDKGFNTCFTYDLDESGVSTAKKGLRNLLIAAPYVFAFVPKIGSITVTSGQYIQTISRGKMIEIELEDAKLTNVVITTNGETKDKYIFVLGKNDVSIAVEVEQCGNNNFTAKYEPQLPKIFCDFPLLGTNDFSFPVVVNSPLFNPTEPRNGIRLTNKEHKQITENKQILMEASQLYIKMVDYFLEKGYQGIYNITKISEQLDKDWLSKEWFEQEIINKLKSHITAIPLISTHNVGKMPLMDESGGTCVFIPKDLDESLRGKVWTLSSELIPDMITKREELECWYNSLWEECRNYGLLDLINRVEAFENISELSKHLNVNVTDWLNELLALFYSNEYSYTNNLGRSPRILPNQYGEFRTLDEVSLDCGIDEVYKDISTVLNLDFKIELLNKEINSKFLTNINKLTLDDVFSEILKKLHRSHPAVQDFYKSIISLQAKQNSEQNDFLNLVCELQGKDVWIRNSVSKHSQDLLKMALKFWREKITKDIGSYESIKIFSSSFRFTSQHEALMWMSNFIRILVKYEQEGLLDQIAILPDQYGNFKMRAELSQDSGEIDEILKDASKQAGYDVRETLLSKDIILELPENRTVYLEDISEKITQYVKENKSSIVQNDIDVKEVFQKTYLWLRENSTNETVKKCFKELLTNIHWFYNDNDIAENMSKIEEYNDILEKYGVSGVQELEQILSRSNVESSSSKTVEISMEILAQWGISTEEDLNRALENNVFGPEFIHDSKRNSELFSYVQDILERSKNKIIEFLEKKENENGVKEYDVSDPIRISNTIFVIKKHGTDIYLITRPSDYGQIILYYGTELDMLDYEKDCELWVEDDKSEPQKITFGKILKLTGVNKIPLRSIREK
ncbi:hypothetical protein J2T13_002577 [Paenibacillus sp. DS2015]|uniref:sacsin N-terminal ATP-binding-like domain-containing protein n=1 Tax=Paenibacillus sp. DS2015 TaxID=3373917 RepID=UPI003D1E823D